MSEKTFDDYFKEALKGNTEQVGDENQGVENKETTPDETKPKEQAEKPESPPSEDVFNKIPNGSEEAKANLEENIETEQEDPNADYKSLYLREKQKSSSWDGRIRKANERAEEAEGKLKDALDRSKALEQELQQKAKSPNPQNETLPNDAGSSDESQILTNFYSNFPDLKKPLELMIKAEAAKIVDTKTNGVDFKSLEAERAITSKDRHFKAITDTHPDFYEIRDSGLVKPWVDAQPSFIRNALAHVLTQGNAQEVVELITSFKKSTGYKPKSTPNRQDAINQKKVDSLLAVEGSSAGPPKGKPDANDFDSAWAEANAKPKT